MGAGIKAVGWLVGLPKEEHLSGIGLQIAGNNSGQGGFAGAVLSNQAMHLAPIHCQRHVLERLGGGKGFADALDLDDRCPFHHIFPAFPDPRVNLVM